jgi:hypothetical protein
LKRPPIRFVEKSPRNSLRIPFMHALFADARFIHLTRDAAPNIASLLGGWQDPVRYNVYPFPAGFDLKGYGGAHWCFVLQPGWRGFDGRSLIEVCVDQWRACNQHCLRDLRSLPGDRVLRVKFENLIRDPREALADIARWADLDPKPFVRFAGKLPVIQASTRPQVGALSEISGLMEPFLPDLDPLRAELGYS